MWTAHFGRGFGPVVRQPTKWMNNPYYLPFLSMDTPVQSQSNECGIFGGHSGNGSCFCPTCSVYPVSFKCGDTHRHKSPILIYHQRMAEQAAVPRDFISPHTVANQQDNKKKTVMTLRVFNFKFSSRCLWIKLSNVVYLGRNLPTFPWCLLPQSDGVNESTMVNLYLASQFRRHSAVLRAHTVVSHTRCREAARADAQVSTGETSLNSHLRLTD